MEPSPQNQEEMKESETEDGADKTNIQVSGQPQNQTEDDQPSRYDTKLINFEEKVVHANDIRDALVKEKKKRFAKKWFTKFNMYKRNHENVDISKKRASSGIGDERIRQMETAHNAV